MPKPELYTVGWICALSRESVAAQLFLDEHHEEGPEYVSQNDNNNYTLGRVGKHNVVVAVPPSFLRTAVSALTTQHRIKGHNIKRAIEAVLQGNPRLEQEYRRPDTDSDRLYRPDVLFSGNDEASASCDSEEVLIYRRMRGPHEDDPAIHYGLVASANQLMKDALIRDELARTKNVLCFEMEAAGLMNHFPCLVIRGISDYCDTHKNDQWQGYAAMTAAAYAKELLLRIHPSQVEIERSIKDSVTPTENHDNSSTTVTFGNQNSGFQAGVLNGPVSGMTFERK